MLKVLLLMMRSDDNNSTVINLVITQTADCVNSRSHFIPGGSSRLLDLVASCRSPQDSRQFQTVLFNNSLLSTYSSLLHTCGHILLKLKILIEKQWYHNNNLYFVACAYCRQNYCMIHWSSSTSSS